MIILLYYQRGKLTFKTLDQTLSIIEDGNQTVYLSFHFINNSQQLVIEEKILIY